MEPSADLTAFEIHLQEGKLYSMIRDLTADASLRFDPAKSGLLRLTAERIRRQTGPGALKLLRRQKDRSATLQPEPVSAATNA
jgi:hypothetical protein